MKREEYRQKIEAFLLHKGADKFWANSALRHIMLNFAGNNYWITNIRNLKVIIGQHGMVNRFTMICTINSEAASTKGRFTYSFGAGHKVRITAIE